VYPHLPDKSANPMHSRVHF